METMKQMLTLVSALALVLTTAVSAFAAEPDKPGTKLITVQAGYGPGIGAVVSGNIALANLGSGHLYSGIQLGGNFRHGFEAQRTDLSIAPRVFLGFPLSRTFEFHFGALAGVAVRLFPDLPTDLKFSYAGFGGFRLAVSDSVSLIAEGYYAYPRKYLHVPYGTAGLAFRF